MKIEIKNRFNDKIILCGEYENIKDCLEKNRGADLRGAYLEGADLYGADLRGAKNYSENREFFMQLVRNNLIKFSVGQQEIASRIFALEFCWETIKKEYGKEMGSIFKILKDLGWGEYSDKWKEELKGER